ncbi:hypothetical protein [Pseudooceanicola sp. HF7]|uniref:DUF6976 family protein n=1 Tax=Pseudooceanicola sp. HF7 TaxID=2721560 RepID=UPI001431640A|nr:hypothetical protein [Pseudooceanicola sp. HF7]NIZ10455.1 hypothetical protein [Pseudooceanicola sp. HF7]
MKTQMLTVRQAAQKIRDGGPSGMPLVIAGSEEALRALPCGNWIGGTACYFLTEEGGICDSARVMVTEIPSATDSLIRHVPAAELPSLTSGRFGNGMSFVLIPAFSTAHQRFAIDGPGYEGLFDQPLMGWVTGRLLEAEPAVLPLVIDGTTGRAHADGALIMHLALPPDRMARIDIVTLFDQDADPARSFTFTETGFSARTALVGGQEVDLATYLTEQGIDTRLPLVADYAGALVNVSFREVSAESGVSFYAPVMAGVEYRLARPLALPYPEEFARQCSGDGGSQLACNCILNYVHGGLEGRSTGSFTGPATFGEIAYMLLNQTMVRLEVVAAEGERVA